jgi:hypothetical protein
MLDEEGQGRSGEIRMASIVGLQECWHGQIQAGGAGFVGLRSTQDTQVSVLKTTHLSIHDTFTATLDSGILRFGGSFAVISGVELAISVEGYEQSRRTQSISADELDELFNGLTRCRTEHSQLPRVLSVFIIDISHDACTAGQLCEIGINSYRLIGYNAFEA